MIDNRLQGNSLGQGYIITRKGRQFRECQCLGLIFVLHLTMIAYGIFPDDPADFADVPSFVASMAPAIQVIFSPQLKDFAAELFPRAGSDAWGGMVSYKVVDIAAILAGCTICESAADLNPFLVCPTADKLGRILHVYDSLKVEAPDVATPLSLIEALWPRLVLVLVL